MFFICYIIDRHVRPIRRRSQLWLVHSLELEVSEHFHDELDGPDVVTQNQIVPGVASGSVINVPELVRHG